ncbi:hypothetical protein BT67DRAFT_443137 [Trichocladium antarcticum]|uniref:DNA polymerase delta subunit 4 n=1 Tax=Trichocladium antarcticum TaxID=1450529 RepID=A0AAN6UI17_9PEZI|nr:hypothetical protein BT67DRAFT_443137 [Trichocladium antarcticum]
MAPTTRKSSRASAGPGKQQTLSFKNKVTKSIKTGKEDYKSPSRAKEYIPEGSPTPQQTTEPPVSPTTPTLGRGKAEPADGAPKLRQAGPQTVVVEKPETERRAERVSKAAVEKYWGGIEKSRLARAVHAKHAEGLSTGEKVLRYFDVSSQYGPCIGIPRVKRWQRAQRLGLNPPIEVLAVLLKEERAGNTGIERAHMDEIMSSTAMGAV